MAPKKDESKPEEAEEAAEEVPTSGNGSFFFTDGATYEGDWESFEGVNKKNGKGKAVEGDTIYEGDWKEDKMHGKGKFTFPSGAVYEVRRPIFPYVLFIAI
mmetsp:Transcript_42224/g.108743  ORF Transcript_42224/g.108743 Transcript_42224/m.108743 type:complete len:101 (-) Transcript_42224:393-695(-)